MCVPHHFSTGDGLMGLWLKQNAETQCDQDNRQPVTTGVHRGEFSGAWTPDFGVGGGSVIH